MNKLRRMYDFYVRHVSTEDTTSLAYYFILSLIPAATLLASFAQMLHFDLAKDTSVIKTVFNENIANSVIELLTSRSVSYYSIITLLICLYVCSKGIYRVTRTVDYMYKVDPKPYMLARFTAALNTLLLVILILGLMVLMTIVPFILNFLNLGPIWSLIQFGGGFFFVLIIMLIMFKVVPSIPLTLKEIYRGALVTSILFILIIFGFSIYLRFANYTTIYGPFASVAVLLLMFDFFAKAIYIGFAVNALDQYIM